MTELPRKLRSDGIVEALLEVRFESTSVPELLLGKLAGLPLWSEYSPTRLPTADIPHPVRMMDPNFRFQPTIQMTDSSGRDVVKIGENVASRHVLNNYSGWESFQPNLIQLLTVLYENVSGFKPTRLGFRYVNLLNSSDHFIESINSLNLSVEIGGKQLLPPFNLNYSGVGDKNHHVLVRIASPEFVASNTEIPFSTLIDVDVMTPEGLEILSLEYCVEWLEQAHYLLKLKFFELIKEETVQALVEN